MFARLVSDARPRCCRGLSSPAVWVTGVWEVVGCDYGLVCGFVLVCRGDNEVVAIWAAEDGFGDALQVEIAGGLLSA